jgi:hypothetical protein
MIRVGIQRVGIFRSFGDSVTFGDFASPISTNSYINLLAGAIARPISNFAVEGDMVPDQTAKVYGVNPAYGDISTIMLGINDQRIYGVDATKLGYWRRGLQCLIAYLGLGNKQFGVSSGTFTGTWANTTAYGLGKVSATNGSTATFFVNGTTVYVGMIQQDGAAGTFDVKIDGTTVGSYTTQTTGLGPTVNGATFGAMLLRFPNLSAGTHTVEIVVTSATATGNNVYVDWVAGNAQSVKPRVYAGNVLYAESYSAGGSAANVDSYNAEHAALTSELADDGLNVTAVDVHNIIPLNTTYMDGGVHPINPGHAILAIAYEGAFS